MDQSNGKTAALPMKTVSLRIDGELVFPAGHAVAWREMAQLLEGQVPQVLVRVLLPTSCLVALG